MRSQANEPRSQSVAALLRLVTCAEAASLHARRMPACILLVFYLGKGDLVLKVMRSLAVACGLAACLTAAPTRLAAQSLEGTWVSSEPILACVRFSLTFLRSEYRIDCSLGQTLGTWLSTDREVHFTPTMVGIRANVGGFNVWSYTFMDQDTLRLSAGPVSVRLTRMKLDDHLPRR